MEERTENAIDKAVYTIGYGVAKYGKNTVATIWNSRIVRCLVKICVLIGLFILFVWFQVEVVDVARMRRGEISRFNLAYQPEELQKRLGQFEAYIASVNSGVSSMPKERYLGYDGIVLAPKKESWLSIMGKANTNVLPTIMEIFGYQMDRKALGVEPTSGATPMQVAVIIYFPWAFICIWLIAMFKALIRRIKRQSLS